MPWTTYINSSTSLLSCMHVNCCNWLHAVCPIRRAKREASFFLFHLTEQIFTNFVCLEGHPATRVIPSTAGHRSLESCPYEPKGVGQRDVRFGRLLLFECWANGTIIYFAGEHMKWLGRVMSGNFYCLNK